MSIFKNFQKTNNFPSNFSSRPSQDKNRLVPKLILVLIIIVSLIVAIAVTCSFLLSSENRVKSSINSLASAYYEDYFYPNIITSPKYSGDINLTMQKYTERGFAPIPLRQILSRVEFSQSDLSLISSYCDLNRTFIKFYPDAPFSSTAYHIDYTYSCEF